jgi:hypothetical protein
MKQKGGLKLKNKEKKGFQPIYDMITKPNSVLDVLTCNSLKGFMISLDVDTADSEYLALDSSQFTVPVTNFILKFALISLVPEQDLPDYEGMYKSTESKQSYFDEAKLQQIIWKKSILGGRPEICPPVANFSLFDNTNSKSLLKFLLNKTKTKGNSSIQNVFNYLLNNINNNTEYNLGLIMMPRIMGSYTMNEFFRVNSLNESAKLSALEFTTAQVARLFIDIGIIHFDLHTENILVYVTADNKIKSVIIDFGRASNINNDEDDLFLSEEEKRTLIVKKNRFYNELFSSDVNKKTFILEVLDFIAGTDFTQNQRLFNYSNKDRFQMD